MTPTPSKRISLQILCMTGVALLRWCVWGLLVYLRFGLHSGCFPVGPSSLHKPSNPRHRPYPSMLRPVRCRPCSRSSRVRCRVSPCRRIPSIYPIRRTTSHPFGFSASTARHSSRSRFLRPMSRCRHRQVFWHAGTASWNPQGGGALCKR